jgi:replicative DNA helicase
MSAENPTEIVFSADQQLALLGHAVTNQQVYEVAQALGVTGDWFFNPNQKSVWDSLAAFETQHRRHPTLTELGSMPAFVNEETRITTARITALNLSIEAKVRVGFDAIVPELREWAKGQRFVEAMVEADRRYTNKDVAAAYKIIMTLGGELDRLDAGGLVVRCQASSVRTTEERQERIDQQGKLLSYGISYLDEVTGGIPQNELIVVGAKTGVGKTQLITQIAATNAKQGKRVALFALEAEKYEIERRIKFGILSRRYRVGVNRGEITNPQPLDYRSWRQGKYEDIFGKWDETVNRMIAKDYATLNTIYRSGGNYSMKELERDITRLATNTDLIIVDHLHYIDIDGDNENHEVTEIMKNLRDLAIMLGKPIVLVAHMRKTMGGKKNAPLVPDLEDFHGASNITKIATTCIILAPCYDAEFTGIRPDSFYDDPATKQSVTSTLWPTYIRVAKFRLDGAITRHTAVAFFDSALGAYREEYAVGRLVANDCHWEPEKYHPYWATHGSISLHPTNR